MSPHAALPTPCAARWLKLPRATLPLRQCCEIGAAYKRAPSSCAPSSCALARAAPKPRVAKPDGLAKGGLVVSLRCVSLNVQLKLADI